MCRLKYLWTVTLGVKRGRKWERIRKGEEKRICRQFIQTPRHCIDVLFLCDDKFCTVQWAVLAVCNSMRTFLLSSFIRKRNHSEPWLRYQYAFALSLILLCVRPQSTICPTDEMIFLTCLCTRHKASPGINSRLKPNQSVQNKVLILQRRGSNMTPCDGLNLILRLCWTCADNLFETLGILRKNDVKHLHI